MDNKIHFVLIFAGLYSSQVYGIENGTKSFCVTNDTTGCWNFIQCTNGTFSTLNVYFSEVECNKTGRLWCIDIVIHTDVLNSPLSATFQERFLNKTSINVSTLQELKTGRYVLDYTCGVNITEHIKEEVSPVEDPGHVAPPLEVSGKNIALIASLTFVALLVVLAIPLSIILKNRQTRRKPEILSQDNAMYIPYNDDCNVPAMATTSQTNVHDQDGHIYDHTYVSSIDNRSDKAVEMNYEHVHYKNVTELNKGQWDNKTETSEEMGGDYVYSQVKK